MKNDEELFKKLIVMDYNELSDFLENAISSKMQLQKDPVLRDIFFHMRWYFRIQGMINNLVWAKAGVTKDAVNATIEVLADDDQKGRIVTLIEKMAEEHNRKLMEDINNVEVKP